MEGDSARWWALVAEVDGNAPSSRSYRIASDSVCRAALVAALLAEVDGNRTRLRGNASHTRFEGGGAHQVLIHLLAGRSRRGEYGRCPTVQRVEAVSVSGEDALGEAPSVAGLHQLVGVGARGEHLVPVAHVVGHEER